MRNKAFKCSKLLLFFKKIQVNMVKNVKNCSKSLLCGNCIFVAVFYVFHHVNLNFFLKNNKSLEHLNALLRIFFVSGVFQNSDVDFWPLLKAEKVLAPKQFSREKIFLQKFIFNHLFESINFQPAGFLAFKEKSGPLLQP